MTSKNLLNKYWEKFEKNCNDRHDPFEKYINEIYQDEICISPIKSLSLHLSNVNSSYGFRHNGGNSQVIGANGLFVGGGGAGAGGGNAASGADSGGGGASGYSNGSVTMVSAQQGGNNSDLAFAVIRLL